MMNTLVFIGLLIMAEVWIVWLAYSMGHSAGWCEGMDTRKGRR